MGGRNVILKNHGGSLELKKRKWGLSRQEIFQEAAEPPHPKHWNSENFITGQYRIEAPYM